MSMAAAWMGRRKIVAALASTIMRPWETTSRQKILAPTIARRWETTRTGVVSSQRRFLNPCTNGPNMRRSAVEECFVPHPRRYGTSPSSAMGMNKFYRSADEYNYHLAVDKAIQHYNKHIKVEEEDGQSIIMTYPPKGVSEHLGCVTMFHIFLKTRGGQKYVAIYVGSESYEPMKLDHGALRLAFFSKLHKNVSIPLCKVIGKIRWPVSPQNDPLIMAAARFALAQHNKGEKLTRLIRANSQMVGDYEIFRMTLKGEFTNYDAIVLVPRNNPEKMELASFKTCRGWQMYGRVISEYGSKLIVPYNHPRRRYNCKNDDVDEYYDDGYDQYEDDECVTDDPRVTAAARFALAQHNKEDQVRRVVSATRRTYSGDEILSLSFDGELDGSRFYQAIVLVDDVGNMRVAYFGRNGDDYVPGDPDDYPDEWSTTAPITGWPLDQEPFAVDKEGFDECSVGDPRVTEAARFALATYIEKDKLVRVVKATSQKDSRKETYRVRFVGEDHPSRTFVAMVSVPVKDPQRMNVEYVSSDGVKYVSVPMKDPEDPESDSLSGYPCL